MKIEQDVQQLKHKPQQYLIKDKKAYDKSISNVDCEGSYLASEKDLHDKEEALSRWLEDYPDNILFSAITQKVVKSVKVSGLFWDSYKPETFLVDKPLKDLPELPEGLFWEHNYNRGILTPNFTVYGNSWVSEVSSKRQELKYISLNGLASKSGAFKHYQPRLLPTRLHICTKTLGYLKINPYQKPTLVTNLLDKVLLAEQFGSKVVILEDEDLQVLGLLGG